MFFISNRERQLLAKVSERMDSFDKILQTSFSNVRNDVSHMKEWVKYLHHVQDRSSQEIQLSGRRIDDMEVAIKNTFTKQEIHKMVDEYYAHSSDLHSVASETKSEFQREIQKLHATQSRVFSDLYSLKLSLQKQIHQEIEDTVKLEVATNTVAIKSLVETSINERFSSVFARLDELKGRTEIPPVSEKIVERASNLKEKIYRKISRHSKEYVKSMLFSLIKKYGRISALNLREIVVEEQGIVSKSSFYRLLQEIEAEAEISTIHDGKEKHYSYIVVKSA